jgi:hypothetical protein
MKIVNYIIFILLVIIALIAIIFYTKSNIKETIIKHKIDTIYTQGNSTITIQYKTKIIHDTLFKIDTLGLLKSDFILKADSCVTKGQIEYIDSLTSFSFTNVTTSFPMIKIKQIDTLKILDSVIVERKIEEKLSIWKKIEYVGYGAIIGILINILK